MPKRSAFPLLLLGLLLLAGCIPSLRRSVESGAPAPAAAVERFLRLADEKEFSEMAWVFGTAEGPYAKQVPPRDAELRMYLFSCLLRHERHAIRGERPVPGTVGAAVEYDVLLTKRGWEGTVPFRAVRGPEGRWFVEEFGIAVLTNTLGTPPPDCVNPPTRGAR